MTSFKLWLEEQLEDIPQIITDLRNKHPKIIGKWLKEKKLDSPEGINKIAQVFSGKADALKAHLQAKIDASLRLPKTSPQKIDSPLMSFRGTDIIPQQPQQLVKQKNCPCCNRAVISPNLYCARCEQLAKNRLMKSNWLTPEPPETEIRPRSSQEDIRVTKYGLER